MSIPTPEELAIIFSEAQSEFALSSWMSSPRSQAAAGCATVRDAVLEGAAKAAIARNGSEMHVGYPDQTGDIAVLSQEFDGFATAEFLRSLRGEGFQP